MKKKTIYICISILLIIILLVLGYHLYQKNNTDAMIFKREYESLNGKINEKNDLEYPSVSISSNNPFIYKELPDIVNLINNRETFLVYFGFESCPWCRNIVPNIIKAASDLKINEIYYVNIKNSRNVMIINEDNNLETIKMGTDAYYKLINLLDNVLDDYELINLKGKTVNAGKRIYAPNIIAVINGKAVDITTGISDKQTDPYINMDDKMQKESYEKIKEVLSNLKVDNACSAQTAC